MTPSLRARQALPLSEAEYIAGMKLVKSRFEKMRTELSLPVRVVRVRRTRSGWAAVYQVGDAAQRAFAVDVRSQKANAVSPEWAAEQWDLAL